MPGGEWRKFRGADKAGHLLERGSHNGGCKVVRGKLVNYEKAVFFTGGWRRLDSVRQHWTVVILCLERRERN